MPAVHKSGLGLAALAALCVLSLFLTGCPQGQSKKQVRAPAVPVTTAQAVRKDVPIRLNVIGNVEPYATVSIKARVGGELQKVNFQEGEDVKKGDLLFVIDPRPLEAALKEAQARLTRDRALLLKAEADLSRYTDLIRMDLVSREAYEQVRATAESLKATVNADEVAVQNARLQLSYCYIHSPISGRTGNLLANQGNLIKADADKAMLVINQIQPIYVAFSVPERHLPEIKSTMAQEKIKVEARLPQGEGPIEEGILTFINNTVDTATGTILLKATFANQDKRLWPGLFADVTLNFGTEKNALAVPAPAVQTGQEGTYVFVVKPDQTVEMRPVKVGRSIDGEVVLKEGVAPGETVVTRGQLRLVPGAKVEIKNSEGARK